MTIKFKICLLGDFGVGKRDLLYRLESNRFPKPKMTIGVDISIKTFMINNEEIRLHFWDNCNRIMTIPPLAQTYLRGVSGLILVYSITNAESFKNLEKWLEIYQAYTDIGEYEIATVLLGCKADLEDHRAVTIQEAQEFAHKHDIKGFFECSAKTGVNVEEAFLALISEIERVRKEFKELMASKILERNPDVIYNYIQYKKGENINRKEVAYFNAMKNEEITEILEEEWIKEMEARKK